MYMAYSNNPNLPRVRMEAVRFVRSGKSIREAARRFGYSHGAVINWIRRAGEIPSNSSLIPTRSSRPYHHPQELPLEMIQKILEYRERHKKCAFITHYFLQRDGHSVSLSSVKRTLQRYRCSRFSKWKKWHRTIPRPLAEKPGILVETDTIHDGRSGDQLYIYTLLDVYSRWAYALPSLRINTHRSLQFVERARRSAPFSFATLQSDHGSEFSKWFTTQIESRGLSHRHSRVRRPNDNAHLERFNRTIQEECIVRIPRKLIVWRKEIPEYLRYYNEERPHMGLDMKTPAEKIAEVVRRY